MTSPRVLTAVLFLAISALYLPSVRNGFVYDDHEVILMQEAPRGIGDVARIFAEPHGLPLSKLPYYRAVTRATLLLQKSLHGDAPAPFHALNALLGGAAAALAFGLLRRPCFGLGDGAAFAGAALFAAHPVMSACVHPIASGRETLLPAALSMGAMAGLLSGEARARAAGVACFALALLGKESAIVLPAAVVWADLLGVGAAPKVRGLRRWLTRLAPLVAVVVGYLLLRAAIFGVGLHKDSEPAPVLHLSGLVSAVLFALQVVFAPFVELRYEPVFASWWSPGRSALAVLVFAFLVALGLWRSDAAWRRRTLFWLGFSAVFLLPTANLVRQEAPWDERFVLLSSLGAAALAVGVIARAGEAGRRIGFAVCALAVILLATVSLGRTPFYRDALAFQGQWAKTSPDKANARFSYGTALLRTGDAEAARAELEAAVRLSPAFAQARFNLAVADAELGALDEAAEGFRSVLRIQPDDAEAARNLGVLERLRRDRAAGGAPPDPAPGR